MQHVLALRHSILLAQHAVLMRKIILGGLLTFFLTGRQDTSPGLILEGNPRSRISVRVGRHSLRD